jgi:hypothetical protein
MCEPGEFHKRQKGAKKKKEGVSEHVWEFAGTFGVMKQKHGFWFKCFLSGTCFAKK